MTDESWRVGRRAGMTRSALWQAGMIVAGVALLVVSAKIKVPFWPVPITMQSAAALLLAGLGGFRIGTASVGLYLLAGIAGFPVFATGGGVDYLGGPTGGYLVGGLAGAALLGLAVDQGWARGWMNFMLFALAADMLIFAVGFSWLAGLLGPHQAFVDGVLPFLPAEALKIALVTGLVEVARRAVARHG